MLTSPSDSGPLTLAIDTETYYDSKVSVKTLGLTGYLRHPEFECYLVSAVGSDGFQWRGHPKDAPWAEFARYNTWVSHNQGFDGPVIRQLQAGGPPSNADRVELFPKEYLPTHWHCTANLMVFLGYPRALGMAVSVLYNEKVNKEVRDVKMLGVRWADMAPGLQEEVLKYALDDSIWCLKLWQDYQHEWPEVERRLSAHTYLMGERGLPIDLDGILEDIQTLGRVIFANEARIPWVAEGFPPLSPKALALKCREVGIDPPASLAQDSEECAAWEAQYGSTYEWVASMRSWRRANALKKKYEVMRDRAIWCGDHYRLPYSLLYFGASTGRWAGAGGFNAQNMGSSPLYLDDKLFVVDPSDEALFDKDLMAVWVADKIGVYMRGRIKASPGKKLVISDLSQIEPRKTAYLSGNRKFLDLVRKGIGPYEAHARKTMGWAGGPLKKESPALYALAKARLIALAYAAGWFKFIDMARMYVRPAVFKQIFEKEPTAEQVQDFLGYLYAVGFDKETGKVRNTTYAGYFRRFPKLDPKTQWVWTQSWLQVTDFRENEPELRALWKRLREELQRSVGGNYFVTLPSGREVRYYNVTSVGEEGIRVQTTKGGHASRAHHGIIIENITQAAARDVFGEAVLRIEYDLGQPVVLHIHDEAVAEVPEDFDHAHVTTAMTTNPSWCRSLPIGAETESTKTYKK
jgi:hypothetical protein